MVGAESKRRTQRVSSSHPPLGGIQIEFGRRVSLEIKAAPVSQSQKDHQAATVVKRMIWIQRR